MESITIGLQQTTDELEIFSREDAFEATLNYFNGDELAANVWIDKYALKDEHGRLRELVPSHMHWRMAYEIHRIEDKYPNPMALDFIFSLFDKFKYIIPQGSPMSGIGNDFQTVSLSNCFVVGNEGSSDSYGAIMKTDQEQVQLMKRRGGVGHTLEAIRPENSLVKNSALTSTGVVPFMERYSNSTREVAQGGRRGALMLSMSIRHPDSEKFIDAKLDGTKITGANISIKAHDDFMKAVVGESGKYIQQWPVDSKNPSVINEIDAHVLWDKIIHNAWKTAEPGVLFWDKIISESLGDRYKGYETVSTNPCGEIGLPPDDSCRLLAVNLLSYVENAFTDRAKFNFELFKEHAGYALRIMDDIIDLESEKIDKIIEKIKSDPESEATKQVELDLWKRIKTKCIEGRRTGVGITAEGDMLAALGLTYGTKEATKFATKVHKTYALEVFRSSMNLAKERGAFKIWDPSLERDHPFLNRINQVDPQLYADLMKYGRRNIACLTIAPTGSVSLMAQTSSGIEPAFSVSYKRRKKVNPGDKNVTVDFTDDNGDTWEEFNVFHHSFKKWIDVYGNKYLTEDEINGGLELLSDELVDKLIEASPYYKAMANDVDWVEKVRMQGKIQEWVDHSISVTVNLPEDVSEELVNEVYVTAWKEGCKGCTIYRDGSRSGVLISKEEKQKAELFKESHAPKRPKSLDCTVMTFMNKGEKWIGFIGLLDSKPYEIFTGVNDNFPIPSYIEKGEVIRSKGVDNISNYDFKYIDKSGREMIIPGLNHAFNDEYYDMAKTFSAILRHGMPLPYVVDLLDGLNLDGDFISTWKAGVKRMFKKYIKDGTDVSGKKCPSCDSEALEYKEGCLTCSSCGHGNCG